MANYKVVDTDQLDADLKVVADAIREKGGTTDELAFPDGMATAVSEIQSGGGDDVVAQFVEGTIPEVVDENATKIRDYGFAYSEIKTVKLPNVTYVGNSAFRNSALTTVELDKYDGHSASNIKYMFAYCQQLQNVYIPIKTFRKSLGTSAFENCKSLREICIYCSSVADSMFNGCDLLEKVDSHKSPNVQSYSFGACFSLTAVVLRRSDGITSLLDSNAFYNCYHFHGTVNATYNPNGLKDGYIYVPRALVDTYKKATNWTTLADQFRALEDYTVDGTTTGAMDWDKIKGGA